jgi:hypothetical protein
VHRALACIRTESRAGHADAADQQCDEQPRHAEPPGDDTTEKQGRRKPEQCAGR